MFVRNWVAILIGVLALPSTAAASANWVKITIASNGSVLWYDSESMTRDGDIVTVWVRWDKEADKSATVPIKKDQMMIICSRGQARLLYSIEYKIDGSLQNSSNTPFSLYEPLSPDSVGSAIKDAVCAAR